MRAQINLKLAQIHLKLAQIHLKLPRTDLKFTSNLPQIYLAMA